MELHWNRMAWIAKIRMHQRVRKISIWMLGFLTISTLVILMAGIDADIPNTNLNMLTMFHNFFFMALILAGTVRLASTGFDELRSQKQLFSGFMLPASALEKWLVEFLFSAVGWAIFAGLFYWCYAQLLNLLLANMKDLDFMWFAPSVNVNDGFLGGVGDVKYLFLAHSIVFLGASFFKKRVLTKMVFVTAVLYGIWLFVSAQVFGALFPDTALLENGNAIDYVGLHYELSNSLVGILHMGHFGFVFVLIPGILYYVSYQRVKRISL
jgi:hypothetical protein